MYGRVLIKRIRESTGVIEEEGEPVWFRCVVGQVCEKLLTEGK